jgi:peptide/nickel transport system substrate-binding protein
MRDWRLPQPRLTRRDFLMATAAAAGAYALPGRVGLAADVPMEFDGSKFQLKALEPNPKSGGVLRYGVTMRPPHFDIHQSGTINNLGSQGCMFDKSGPARPARQR